MTTRELARSDACVARMRSTPAGEIEFVPGDADASVYGTVEIAWYPDRVEVTTLGAGPASRARTFTSGAADQDIVIEIRLPRLDELTEVVPGAD